MQKLQGADIDTHVIAIYLNLILKNGPADDDIRGDKGDISMHQLSARCDDIAFGMPSNIYNRLSTDAFERMAKRPAKVAASPHPIPNPDDRMVTRSAGSEASPFAPSKAAAQSTMNWRS